MKHLKKAYLKTLKKAIAFLFYLLSFIVRWYSSTILISFILSLIIRAISFYFGALGVFIAGVSLYILFMFFPVQSLKLLFKGYVCFHKSIESIPVLFAYAFGFVRSFSLFVASQFKRTFVLYSVVSSVNNVQAVYLIG